MEKLDNQSWWSFSKTIKNYQIIKLYFKQPNVLYQHLFGSFHQLIEEIIPSNICDDYNYFYESGDNHNVYLHGFKCENVRIKPPTVPNTNELLTPKQARKKHLKYLVAESQTSGGLNEQGVKELRASGYYRSLEKTLNSILKRLNKG